jgi:hypothetical protein
LAGAKKPTGRKSRPEHFYIFMLNKLIGDNMIFWDGTDSEGEKKQDTKKEKLGRRSYFKDINPKK